MHILPGQRQGIIWIAEGGIIRAPFADSNGGQQRF